MPALLLHLESAWHVRVLARCIDAFPSTTNRELIKLAGASLLLHKHVCNQIHYRANRGGLIFPSGRLAAQTAGLADVLTEALRPVGERIGCALMFGLVACGEETGILTSAYRYRVTAILRRW